MTGKIKLDMADLKVDSFEASPEQHGRGTVHGHWTLWCDSINDYTCNGNGTCGVYPCHAVP